ncbi:hypothetical protein TWF694_001248 [Orbilia ellipsospora]|uniref:RRM domain-containing protein n=1 Tax=Orbilia ellipsospora TaxID=2528407 RepID=A0AAV9XTM8_9PEZI
MVRHCLVGSPTSMDYSKDPQRVRAYAPYPMIPQSYPAAGPAGNQTQSLVPSQSPLPNFPHQQHQLNFENMNYQNIQYSPVGPFAYNPHYPVMVPPHFQMHTSATGPNLEQAPYYHPQAFPNPPLYPPTGFVPTYPAGYSSFVNPQQLPYNQNHLPSPVQSVATSVESAGFSNSQAFSSPTTTVASPTTTTATQKRMRKSPVIASTPLNTLSAYEDELADLQSPTMSDFSCKGGPTNVYIKGLPQTMTDKQLKAMILPFGNVISSKAIIDRPSGVCKGYGFAKFTTLESAQECIKDLKSKNFEATVARDSFYSKLKDLADNDSTNLYVSNLPTNWNEEKITAIFPEYAISKCRLLVNQKGASRGVAFVTFEDRGVCDEIIEKFNGIELDEPNHHLPLQVRYADTLAQKKLKKEKAQVGQFPKKSVLANHEQIIQRSLTLTTGVSDMSLSGSSPLLPQGNQKGWKKSETPINAPPTPPRSVISAEENQQ